MWQGLPFHQLKQMDSLASVFSLSLPLPLPFPFLMTWSPTPPFSMAKSLRFPAAPPPWVLLAASRSSASRAFFFSLFALVLAALSLVGGFSVLEAD